MLVFELVLHLSIKHTIWHTLWSFYHLIQFDHLFHPTLALSITNNCTLFSSSKSMPKNHFKETPKLRQSESKNWVCRKTVGKLLFLVIPPVYKPYSPLFHQYLIATAANLNCMLCSLGNQWTVLYLLEDKQNCKFGGVVSQLIFRLTVN